MKRSYPRHPALQVTRGYEHPARPINKLPHLLGAVLLASILFPQPALAHGIVGKADLPIPVWLFSWAAAIVLVVSFVALSTLWRTPQLQRERLQRVLRLPVRLEPVLNMIGPGLFVLTIYRNVEEAVRSQYWMLAVMVAFTSFGLWLLSAVGT